MKKLLALIVILLFGLLAMGGWWKLQLSPVNSKDQEARNIIIPKGQSVTQTADQLKKENVIRSPLVFKIYIKQQGSSGKIQAGTFKLSPSMSTPQIVEALGSGALEIWVTLPEGWRVEEMAQRIAKELDKNSEEFVTNSKEGYMFPDTYLFPKEITIIQVAKILRDNFEKKFTPELRAKIKAQGLTEEEGVILASIVEREARSDKVRIEVASILLKRLNIDMGLNADATLQYALGYQQGEKSWWKRQLTREDKKVDSPYNTYLHRGLPPAPICNPGLSSLQAVANADPTTPYLYYYHDSKGNSHYAKTLEEHNENIANNP